MAYYTMKELVALNLKAHKRQQEEKANRAQSAAMLVLRVLGRYAPGGNQHPYMESQMRLVDYLLHEPPQIPCPPGTLLTGRYYRLVY